MAPSIPASGEVWRVVTEFPKYEVSSAGNVRSHHNPAAPRLVRTWNCNGYRQVHLYIDSVRYAPRVHQLVCRAFHGPRPEGMEVRHLDGDRTNNRADNLAWGTKAENQLDSVEHGTHAQARKVACFRGHELVGNTVYALELSRGHRICRPCGIARGRARRGGYTGDEPLIQLIADQIHLQILTGVRL